MEDAADTARDDTDGELEIESNGSVRSVFKWIWVWLGPGADLMQTL